MKKVCICANIKENERERERERTQKEGRAKSASQTKLYISQTNKRNETGKYSAIQKEVTEHTHAQTHTRPKFYVQLFYV